jgi:hypothetical protein
MRGPVANHAATHFGAKHGQVKPLLCRVEVRRDCVDICFIERTQ